MRKYSINMIREYRIEDLNIIADIWLEASIIAHDFIPASYWQNKVKDMCEIYIPSSTTFVYTEDELSAPLGFISMCDEHIAAIFVYPLSQGKNIGSELINYVKRDYPSLTLNVYSANKKSISFYIKHGFVIEEEQIDAETSHREFLMSYNGAN